MGFCEIFASVAKLKISFTGPKLSIWRWKNTFRDLLYKSLIGRPSRGWPLRPLRVRPIRALLPKNAILRNQYMGNPYFLQPVLRRTGTIYCKIDPPYQMQDPYQIGNCTDISSSVLSVSEIIWTRKNSRYRNQVTKYFSNVSIEIKSYSFEGSPIGISY